MSKKSKRQVSRQYSRPATRTASGSLPKVAEFNPDYSTTKRELKRIGTLAGAFLVVLVILALFQNQLLAIFVK